MSFLLFVIVIPGLKIEELISITPDKSLFLKSGMEEQN